MLINSILFWVFFTVFLLPYFTLLKSSGKRQNVWLLIASYFFYGWADWRMVGLLIVVTMLYYFLAIAIQHSVGNGRRRANRLTAVGIVCGVGMLAFFKYLNFFIDGFTDLFSYFGLKTSHSTFDIIMPVGISFFTFKLISYVVEVRKQRMAAVTDPIAFATYVAFFPTIMSGPIDRPQPFIVQLSKPRTIDLGQVSEGLKRVLWGMFTKMCVADILVSYTDAVFNNVSHHNASSILFATLLYTFQIYADFNGYSNMAIGTAQVMGIRVTENFNRPYFADSVSDFWRRWHMSLSSWIRDYIYIPLGGNRKGKVRMYVNQLIAMTLCGLWHGASMTFVIWGFVHGMLVCVHKFWSQAVLRHDRHYHPTGIKRMVSVVFTFILVSMAWQLFRANSLADYGMLISQMANGFGMIFLNDPNVFTVGILSTMLMMFKDCQDEFGGSIHFLHARREWVRLASIAVLASYILLFGALDGKTFIYFQF